MFSSDDILAFAIFQELQILVNLLSNPGEFGKSNGYDYFRN
jgi:hypothetical protein